ncbi:MAG TPA: TlpA disulfide reductase family protein [Bacteroidia bacterium]|nr:TlpA disulfide reductase family protein [Bacteroidia bacterium]HNP98946.1 TlpA disulfide reductase family protein [Bacteroidia bacterium]
MIKKQIIYFFLLLVSHLPALKCTAQSDVSGYPVPVIGTTAFNIQGIDSSGNKRDLFSLKENTIFLFFYETSCHLCEAVLPDLIQNYERWKASGIEIYSVAISNDHDIWKGFLREHPTPWINVMDTVNKDTIVSTFKINVSPTIYALDKNKRIASSRMVRAEMIEEWLKENYKSTPQQK